MKPSCIILSLLPWLTGGLCVPCAQAGSVETRAGQSWQGTLRFESNTVIIATEAEAVTTVPLDEVMRIRWVAPPSRLDRSDSAWNHQDVGAVHLPGNTRHSETDVDLEASGWGFGPSGDAFHWSSVALAGDGQITARVAGWIDSNGTVMAGITIRQGDAPASPHASLWFSSTNSLCFVGRGPSNDLRQPILGDPPKRWLRLSRLADRLTGYVSEDGRQWEPVAHLPMDPTIPMRAGVLAFTPGNAYLGTATLDQMEVWSGSPRGLDPEVPAPGILLQDGSALSGDFSFETEWVRLTRPDGSKLQCPHATLAALLREPVPSALVCRPPSSIRAGVLLKDRDWLEGEVKELSNNGVAVTSLLLGTKRIGWWQQPVAVILAGVQPPLRGWWLFLRDGSRVYLGELTMADGLIAGVHPSLGTITVPAADLIELGRIP